MPYEGILPLEAVARGSVFINPKVGRGFSPVTYERGQGWMNAWMDGRTDAQADRGKGGWTDGWMDGWMGGWVDQGMMDDGRRDGWMDGQTHGGRREG